MRRNLPGLLLEKLPSGAARYRVRVRGDASRRLTLPVGQDHPEFLEIYHAARRGIIVAPMTPQERRAQDFREQVKLMHKGAMVRSRERGWTCTLTRDDIAFMLNEQDGKCAVSGKDFDLSAGSSRRRPWAPSVDRIDNSQGYTKENCRLVCLIVNTSRADWADEDFYRMCKMVVASRKRK